MLIVAALLAVPHPLWAIPHFNIERIVADSDVVAIADVLDVHMVGRTTAPVNGEMVPAAAFVGAASIRLLLKGTCPDRIEINYIKPDGLAYLGLPRGAQILFLRRDNSSLTFTDPYYPAMPAASTPVQEAFLESTNKAIVNRVIEELGRALVSSQTPRSDKSLILSRAYAIPNEDTGFTSALIRAVETATDEDIRCRMIALLILRGDDLQVHVAVKLLLSKGLGRDERNKLLYAISEGLTNPKATSEVEVLLADNDVRLRRAAAKALWHIGDVSAVGPLVAALSDPDRDVRYYAVRGLAVIAGQAQWGPGPGEFDSHEEKYLEHWRSWSR